MGLRAAAQLMVGSAVASEQLLLNFRELGIEIHNAYGLTEAPLVTLNRAGANHIGTVGAPLPRTEVRIAEDGEVLVRGPQITAGYFKEDAASPIRDGWLYTGDLGRLTADGYLVLEGRKKELFKTSYGKYIQPGKVEARCGTSPASRRPCCWARAARTAWRCCGSSILAAPLRRWRSRGPWRISAVGFRTPNR
jgi:long-chain acyl-CoA synthetase